ncbi:hypothetical protein M2347_002534 [Chryseobacterium sp. H1D6B]|uniref:hypothetical protein n=1 Tax=Chryseobacterium sp. H1D6B TaxID=2940588 RepID=UPI00182CEF64|nr:hypothetical protein [Chryseobacterium sp. H1D6B]MDH6252807.1 hypothetical protein [Chryseobacterium sp. H1D6B]
MKKTKLVAAFILFLAIGININAQIKNKPSKNTNTMSLEKTKQSIQGEWKSIAPEIRPSALKNEDGTLKPFYLSRHFKYNADDTFELEIINYADAFGKLALAKMLIKGHVEWKGAHSIADGAQKVDFTADTAYEVTPLHPGFLDILNKMAVNGFSHWELNVPQSIFKKSFVPFGLAEGQVFKEYDLIYLHHDMLFWGARNIDGRGFDTEANRPTNLQIPMERQK